jgi:hypothetical protein
VRSHTVINGAEIGKPSRRRARWPAVVESTGYIVDMTMLVLTPGGRERTQAEFQQLLESAEFECTRVIRTGGLPEWSASIVEAQKR